MGFRFRKSVNLGAGFRVNFSKTGIGYSWGMPGVRLTKTATGRNRATLSLPGTGISYVKESGGKRKAKSKNAVQNARVNETPVPAASSGADVFTVENADAGQFAPVQYEAFLSAVKKYEKHNAIWKIIGFFACIGAVWFLLGLGFSAGTFAVLGGFFMLYIILRYFVLRKHVVHLYYEESEDGKRQAAIVDSLVEQLQGSAGLFQLTDYNKINDKKRNAGAGQLISLHPITIVNKCPAFLRTNIDCYCVQLKKEKLYILPEKLLIYHESAWGAINFGEMEINFKLTDYIESAPPKDAKIIGRRWQYVNKDGSRDKRYANNHELYVCEYVKMEFKTKSGFNTVLYASNQDKALGFKKIVSSAKGK
jgi:hypothetical protein